MYKNVGFIGTGNMGSAIVKCLDYNKVNKIFLSNRTSQKAEQLKSQIPNSIVCANVDIAKNCDLIFLAVKPQLINDVLLEIAPILKDRKDTFIICSMATAVTCKAIEKTINITAPIIRIMPNTPASIGEGIILYCGLNIEEKELDTFEEFISNAGLVDKIDEKLIDAASCVSGCGPAFAYMFIEALADGAVACGLPRDKAIMYAAKMLSGASKLVLQSQKHPEQLKDEVCSPAGTTIQGVKALEENGLRNSAIKAICAAYDKTLELKTK